MSEVLKKEEMQLGSSVSPLTRSFAIYLAILLVVSLSIVGIRAAFADSLVIYFQEDKPDFLQVFFPINGTYSEQNSARSKVVVDSSINRLSVTLPLTPINRVRIDPANEPARVVITKVELKHLFGAEIYTPQDLALAAKPMSMIDKLEATPAGLIIHSTGNDPAFELQLKTPTLLSQLITLFIASILLSFLAFLFVRNLTVRKKRPVIETTYLFAIPLLVSIGVAALFYPGFMSYDTLHALRSARNGVTDSMWPPMVSYIWRIVDFVSLNPSAMHLSQVLLLLSSIFFIVFFFTNKNRYATAFLFIYLVIPVILGTVAVIWKDVLMAAFFLASFAVMVFMRTVINKWRFIVLAVLTAFLIFLGVCSRHNAIAAAIPLLFYLSFVVCSRAVKRSTQLWLGVILLGFLLTSIVFAAKTQLDKFSIPGFERLSSSNEFFIRSVRVLDVAGASLCVGSNLFVDMAPNLTLEEIGKTYDPKHINLSRSLLSRVGVDSRIDKIWLNVAVHHPICSLSNKFQLAKYLVGANDGAQFIITHPSIDENEYGYSLPNNSFRDLVVRYIISASHLPFFKPWFLYCISILSFVYLVRINALTASHLVIFLSAFSYFASLVVFGNAADARLPFYTTTALVMFTFISIIEFKKKRYT